MSSSIKLVEKKSNVDVIAVRRIIYEEGEREKDGRRPDRVKECTQKGANSIDLQLPICHPGRKCLRRRVRATHFTQGAVEEGKDSQRGINTMASNGGCPLGSLWRK